MATEDLFVHLTDKKLLGVVALKDQLLEYLRKSVRDLFYSVFNKDGTFGVTALTITGDTSAITIADGTGTDGAGNLLEVGDTEKSVPWDGSTSVCDVALHYAERPVGIQINPRTGMPEYTSQKEIIGVAASPDTLTFIADHYKVRIDALVGDSSLDYTGRDVLIWKNAPAAGATTEGIAIESCTVYYDGGQAHIDTSGLLGTTGVENGPSLYTVCLLGPTIRSDIDLEAAADYWYIGNITNSTGLVVDTGDQRLIEKSLSDLLEYLVYSNVSNTFTATNDFTRKVTVTPSVAERGLDVTGGAGYTAGYFTGGASGGHGVQSYGKGGGHGGIFEGDSSGTGDGLQAVTSGTGRGIRIDTFGGGDAIQAKAWSGNGKGADLTGVGTGVGASCVGGASAAGIYCQGGSGGGGIIVYSGSSGGAAGTFYGPSSGSANGIYAEAGATGGHGGEFHGAGSDHGVKGVAGATGVGGYFTGGSTSGNGVTAAAGPTGIGGYFLGGGSSGHGVHAISSNGDGVRGEGGSGGRGGYFVGNGAGPGVWSFGGATAPGGLFEGGTTSGAGIEGSGGPDSPGGTLQGNGSGHGVVSYGGSTGVGGKFNAGTNGANINLPARSGTPSTLNDGDIWFSGTLLYMRVGGVTKTIQFV